MNGTLAFPLPMQIKFLRRKCSARAPAQAVRAQDSQGCARKFSVLFMKRGMGFYIIGRLQEANVCLLTNQLGQVRERLLAKASRVVASSHLTTLINVLSLV